MISIVLVFLEIKLLDNIDYLPAKSKRAELVVSDKKKYRNGEVFPMDIELHGINTPINAIQTDISYDPNMLEAIEVSTEESFATVFLQREINNDVDL